MTIFSKWLRLGHLVSRNKRNGCAYCYLRRGPTAKPYNRNGYRVFLLSTGYPQPARVIHNLSTDPKVIHSLYISTGYPQGQVIHSLYISTGYPHVNKLWITSSCVPYSFFSAEPFAQPRRPPLTIRTCHYYNTVLPFCQPVTLRPLGLLGLWLTLWKNAVIIHLH